MTQHTPGPWKWSNIYSDEGRLIAMLLRTQAPNQPYNDDVVMAAREDWIGYLTSVPRGEANARLIAQAPAMLALLKGIMDDDDTRNSVLGDKYRAILRAVEGESNG